MGTQERPDRPEPSRRLNSLSDLIAMVGDQAAGIAALAEVVGVQAEEADRRHERQSSVNRAVIELGEKIEEAMQGFARELGNVERRVTAIEAGADVGTVRPFRRPCPPPDDVRGRSA